METSTNAADDHQHRETVIFHNSNNNNIRDTDVHNYAHIANESEIVVPLENPAVVHVALEDEDANLPMQPINLTIPAVNQPVNEESLSQFSSVQTAVLPQDGNSESHSNSDLPTDEGPSARVSESSSGKNEEMQEMDRDDGESAHKKMRSQSPVSDEDGQICSICFESWTNSGDHRIASLSCGHLFGASCIKKWLSQKRSKCPQCNAKARRSEIRLLYARSLKALDTIERDRALRDLEKEREARRHAELATAHARLRYQQAEQEIYRLKDELRKLARHQATVNVTSPQKGSVGGFFQFRLAFRKSFEICKQDSCRVMAACNFMRMLVINTRFENQLFPAYGIKKINTMSMESIEFVNIHTNTIRDMAFSPMQHDGLLLTGSMDCTVALTNMLTNSVVLSYQTQSPVWSCTWNRNNPLQFFAGLQNGVTLLYDTRQTNTYLEKLCTPGSSSPVVALESIDFQPVSAFCAGGVVVGQLERTAFYEARGSEYKGHFLPIDGSLTSIRFEPKSRQLLVSCRPTKRCANVRHMLCEMTSQNWSPDPTVIDNVCSCNIMHVFEGGNRQTYLSRSALIPHPHQGNGLFVCAGDEVKGAMLVWNVESGKCVSELPVPSPTIKDICLVDNRNLAVLLMNNVQIYSIA